MNLPSKAFSDRAGVYIQRLEHSPILPILGVIGTVLLVLAKMGAA